MTLFVLGYRDILVVRYHPFLLLLQLLQDVQDLPSVEVLNFVVLFVLGLLVVLAPLVYRVLHLFHFHLGIPRNINQEINAPRLKSMGLFE